MIQLTTNLNNLVLIAISSYNAVLSALHTLSSHRFSPNYIRKHTCFITVYNNIKLLTFNAYNGTVGVQ